MMRGAVVLLLLLLGAGPDEPRPALVVIVHPSRAADLSQAEVAEIFLKKRRYWPDGSAIVPINREARSPVRQRFETEMFTAEPIDLVAYWNQRYFHGVLPPATLASDEAVRRYVASNPNAIGYVTADQVDDSVRVALRLH